VGGRTDVERKLALLIFIGKSRKYQRQKKPKESVVSDGNRSGAELKPQHPISGDKKKGVSHLVLPDSESPKPHGFQWVLYHKKSMQIKRFPLCLPVLKADRKAHPL
jgi:hypothetical protein